MCRAPRRQAAVPLRRARPASVRASRRRARSYARLAAVRPKCRGGKQNGAADLALVRRLLQGRENPSPADIRRPAAATWPQGPRAGSELLRRAHRAPVTRRCSNGPGNPAFSAISTPESRAVRARSLNGSVVTSSNCQLRTRSPADRSGPRPFDRRRREPRRARRLGEVRALRVLRKSAACFGQRLRHGNLDLRVLVLASSTSINSARIFAEVWNSVRRRASPARRPAIAPIWAVTPQHRSRDGSETSRSMTLRRRAFRSRKAKLRRRLVVMREQEENSALPSRPSRRRLPWPA